MLQFNILYTPGTALPLSRLALTLLREPRCQLRLVANGCTGDESEHLATLCARHDRLTFLRLSSDTPLPHAVALNELQARTDGDYFAIIDSDIFATAPFLPDKLVAGLTCFLPPAVYWDEAEERRQRRRHRMGCTYAAIYDNAALTRVRQATGIGFEKSRWETLTSAQQEALRSVGYVKRRYDTGKALNGVLAARGTPFVMADSSRLRHLGGFSRAHKQRHLLLTLISHLSHQPRLLRAPRSVWKRVRRAHRKQQSSRYFRDLLHALRSDAPLPRLPRMGSRYVEEKMRGVLDDVAAFYSAERTG